MSCNSLPRLVLSSVLCALALAGTGVPTASAAVPDRVAAAIGGTGYVAIAKSINPKVKLGTDLGPAPGNTRLVGMSIRFNMSDAQQAALDQLLANQQNPASPKYHQWLTPAQFGAQFGLSSSDLSKVSAWLTSQGFTVTNVANGGTFIYFDGTAAQVQTAFQTSIHNISLNGETHFANVTNVSVPSALAGVVTGVTGLHNFKLQARAHTSIVKPHFTSSVSGDHYMAPGDIYTIYNSTPLLNASINGTGESIAVTGQVDFFPADIAAFRSAAGLSTTNLPTTVYAYGENPGNALACTSCTTGPNQDDLGETSIDLEWSGAMAPNASIIFVASDYVLPTSMTYAIDNDVAPIVTTSYGNCEAAWGYTELVAMNDLFKQGNAQGQTVLAAAADEGATDCDAGPTATEGLAVDFPGSSPYVTSMGGTQMNDGNATGATQYWNSNSSSTVANAGSAVSYIPEAVWNDEPAFDAYGGGGGGASNFFTKPTWQTGTGVPADGARDVPDLALDASDAHDSLLFCVNTAAAQGSESCTTGFRLANNDLNVAGGTSFDSQIFGGLLALIEQKNGTTKGFGNINPTIYALGNSKYYAAGQNTLTNSTVVFNDVTTGNNNMPCAAGSINCPNGGSIGWSAGVGYDLASGWGSVNVANLANDWLLVTPLGVGTLGPNLSLTSLAQPVPSSSAVGATVTLNATVSGSNVTAYNPNATTEAGLLTTSVGPTPTGTVQFLANNVALGSPVTVTAAGSSTATASYSWVTSCSNLGQQVMSAAYSGDTNYQGSIGPALTADGAATNSNESYITSPVIVQVTSSTCPSYTLAASSTTVNVAAGGTIPAVTITATPANNFAGTITFSATATNTSGYAPTLTFSPATVTISSSSPVTTSLTLSGITAALHLPNMPGQFDRGTVVAKNQSAPGKPSAGETWYATGSGIAVASLLLVTLPRRRRLGGLLLLAVALALIGGATGCGSSQSGPPTTTTTTTTSSSSNPYVGTYIVTVIGTYTNTSGQVTQQTATVTYYID
jgi:subtilase family serine protease